MRIYASSCVIHMKFIWRVILKCQMQFIWMILTVRRKKNSRTYRPVEMTSRSPLNWVGSGYPNFDGIGLVVLWHIMIRSCVNIVSNFGAGFDSHTLACGVCQLTPEKGWDRGLGTAPKGNYRTLFPAKTFVPKALQRVADSDPWISNSSQGDWW